MCSALTDSWKDHWFWWLLIRHAKIAQRTISQPRRYLYPTLEESLANSRGTPNHLWRNPMLHLEEPLVSLEKPYATS